MNRPLPLRTKTTSHCIPVEPKSMPSVHTKFPIPDEPGESPKSCPPRKSTKLMKYLSENESIFENLIRDSETKVINCCGGGCCMPIQKTITSNTEQVALPDNQAYRSLQLDINSIPLNLSGVPDVSTKTVSILPINYDRPRVSGESSTTQKSSDSTDFTPITTDTFSPAIDGVRTGIGRALTYSKIDTTTHPPDFVQPHAPYHVYSSQIFSARELTRPGAEKRTYHFELDVSDYPSEAGIDFKVGGAIGVSTPNHPNIVEDLLNLLCIPRYLRDRPVLLKTTSGRWPTVWGDDSPRELVTTRREILTWCSDVQSTPPTKSILRLLAEYASSESEKKILLFLTSNEGQSVFCNLRTGSYVTIPQLLNAFPSSKPPLDALLSNLRQLMPRFYSLSNDPHDTCVPTAGCKRLIEIAVTVMEHENWDGTLRTGVASGFFERQAKKFIDAEKQGVKPDLRIPMFKGLMANPLARDFVSDGPMLLIGAGVGIAPFRGFVKRRLRNANCANKVWVIQGIRDSLLDELYQGEWGIDENEVKKVVESRQSSNSKKYVQDEVRAQADLVWFVINALDGRVFVCGSSTGMGEGVKKALIDVAINKGNLDEENAKKFWSLKEEAGQYIAELW